MSKKEAIFIKSQNNTPSGVLNWTEQSSKQCLTLFDIHTILRSTWKIFQPIADRRRKAAGLAQRKATGCPQTLCGPCIRCCRQGHELLGCCPASGENQTKAKACALKTQGWKTRPELTMYVIHVPPINCYQAKHSKIQQREEVDQVPPFFAPLTCCDPSWLYSKNRVPEKLTVYNHFPHLIISKADWKRMDICKNS